MGFLGTEAGWFADITLVAQITGFLILVQSLMQARRKDFLKHNKTSEIAVLIGGLSLIWMGFSLISNLLSLVSLTFVGVVILSHSITGAMALFAGLFLVLGEIKKTKASMIIAFSSWAAAMFLGVILYFLLFIQGS